jgi:hypothetical protein
MTLDHGTASLLERLRQPVTYSELAEQLDADQTVRLPLQLLNLVQRGAIVSAAAPAMRHATSLIPSPFACT